MPTTMVFCKEPWRMLVNVRLGRGMFVYDLMRYFMHHLMSHFSVTTMRFVGNFCV